jgi:hypothetical protein
MQLPAEIRNMIYIYTLGDPSGINLVATFKHRRRTVERVSAELMSDIAGTYHWRRKNQINDNLRDKHQEPVPLVPSLLAVSKQIYQEGRDILYNNEFVFADTSVLYHFMLNISPAGAKQLKHLRIMQWNHGRGMKPYNNACFAVLGQATNLQTLHLDELDGYARKPQAAAAQMYRDAFPWFEAIGAAKGKVDAGVDLLQIDPEVFDYTYWHQGTQRVVSGEEKRDEYLEALRKLLGVQQKRLMAPLVKKSKKAKAAVSDVQ